MKQKFSYDALAAFLTLAFIGVFAWIWYRVASASEPYWVEIVAAILITVCLLVCAANAPQYTYIDNNQIVVKKAIGAWRFNRNEIKIMQLDAAELKGGLRTFGSGGLFGYQGWHRFRSIGKCKILLVNRKKSLALIERGDEKYIVHLDVE